MTHFWAPPGGRGTARASKNSVIDRNLLYLAVLMFVNNYCKIMYIC